MLHGAPLEDAHLRCSVGSHLSFQRWTWCPAGPPRIQGETYGNGSSVCFRAHFPLWISGGPSRPGSPSKTPFFCPVPLGRPAPNIYAKSTSPNCRISLQAKFLLSPLTTAVNYKSSAGVWVTARRGDLETQRKGEKKPGNISSYITEARMRMHTGTLEFFLVGPPRLQYISSSLVFVRGFALMKEDQSDESHIVKVTIRPIFLQPQCVRSFCPLITLLGSWVHINLNVRRYKLAGLFGGFVVLHGRHSLVTELGS